MKAETAERVTVSIPSWLPVFPGFYSTLFGPCDERIEETLKHYVEEGYLPGDFDVKDGWKYWDNASYQNEVAKQCVDWVASELPEESGIWPVNFEEVRSPKEYNFTNDSINCTYEVDMSRFTPWIRAYLAEHADAWAKYLVDHYRSRDGFCSFYDHDAESWKEMTEDYSNFDEDHKGGHTFGSVLQFYFNNENSDPVEAMYYSLEVYEGKHLTGLPEVKKPEPQVDAPGQTNFDNQIT